MSLLHLAIAQFRPRKADVPGNLTRIGEVLAQAATLSPRPHVVHFPETATSAYFVEGGVRECSLTVAELTTRLAAAYAVGRSGCWAVGDDYGRPWNSALAVKFPDGAPPSTVGNLVSQFGVTGVQGHPFTDVMGVYPTQLFEVTMGLVMFAILWRMRDHKHAEGWLFGVYCVLAGVERFIVEFFRAKDDRFFAGFTLAQTIAIGFVALGVVWMQMRRTPRDGAPGIYAST